MHARTRPTCSRRFSSRTGDAARHHGRRRARLRLHKRLSRHRELGGDVDLDPRAVAAARRADRGDREPRRSVRDDCGREDGRQGNHRLGSREREDRPRSRLRRDRLESPHLVARAAVLVLPRADRGTRRRRARAVGIEGRRMARDRPQSGDPGRLGADARVRRRVCAPAGDLLGVPAADPRRREPLVSARPARDRHLGGFRARRQRRPEDDGRDRARPLRPRQSQPLLHSDLGQARRRARDRGRNVLGRLADHPDARPARLPDGSARADSPRRRPPARSSSPRRSTATRSRPPTSSRAP